MNENIIIGLLSLTGTVVGSLGGVLVSSKLTNYRISQLEKKVEKLGSITEHMYAVENKIDILQTRNEISEKRIEILEAGA